MHACTTYMKDNIKCPYFNDQYTSIIIDILFQLE